MKRDKVSNKKRRLRKKLHIGEFKESGFRIDAYYSKPLSLDQIDSETDSFIDMIEANGMVCFSFHDDRKIGATVLHRKSYTVLDERHYSALMQWASNNPLIDQTTLQVSEISDTHDNRCYEELNLT